MTTVGILSSLSLVTLGAVLGIGIWQYRSVRQSQRRRGEDSDPGGPRRPGA